MNEVTINSIIPPAAAGNLTNLIAERAHFEPERVIVSRPLGDGWQAVTAKAYEEEIKAVAKGFIASGINVGDRVAIMAKTRYEWTVLDFAIWYAGAVPVPIYETSSAEQVDWILTDSAAVAIIVETPALVELVTPVMPASCKNIWNITYNALATLAHDGKDVSDEEISKRRAALKPETLATLIYTSGTTGKPKGVQLTHGNFLSECGNVVNGASDLFLKPGGSTLLFLPVAHVFGRMVQIGAITAGLHLAHCSDLTRLPKDLGSFKPTFVLAVPRIFEKIFNGAEAKAEAAGKGKIFHKAAEVAIAYSRALDAKSVPPLLKLQHGLFDKLVYSKIRAGLGGRVEAAISGGAPLGERLGHFYRGAGVRVLEGYGLTEVLEDRLRSNPLISQCMVVGDNKPFIAALITLDPDSIRPWAVANKKENASIAELAKDPTLIAVIQTAVDDTNKAVSRAESIRKFSILPVDFTIAGGQLTAKLSVKRHVVSQQFAREIDELFA